MKKLLIKLGLISTVAFGGLITPIVPVTLEFVESDQVPHYDTIDGKLHEGDWVILENGVYAAATSSYPYLEKITPEQTAKYTERHLLYYDYPAWYKDPSTGLETTSTLNTVEYQSLAQPNAVNPTLTVDKSLLQIITN